MSAADTIRDALESGRSWATSPPWVEKLDAALAALDELESELESLTVGRATLEDQTNRAELAEAQRDALESTLRQIADPSYVGNYSTDEIVQIHRKWAGNALAALSGGSE